MSMGIIASLGAGILGIAFLFVAVSRNSDTANIIKVAGGAFNNALGTAMGGTH